MKVKILFFSVLILINTYVTAQEEVKQEFAVEVTSTQDQDEAQVVNIGLSQEIRQEIGNSLNKLLSDEYVLYVKLQNFHWNVYGQFFNDLHAFFQKLYEQQQMVIDGVAERIRSLAIRANGSLTEFLQNTHLSEQTNGVPTEKQMLKILLDDYQTLIQQIRGDIVKTAELNDWADNNFLSDLIQKHEKTAWMLRALLAKQEDK